MTEQPDTAGDSGRDYAHVLEWFRETKGVGIAPVDIVLALRDLDAARAMRDTHAADVTDLANKHARALDCLAAANELGNNMTIGLGRAAQQRDEAIELCREMIGYVPGYFVQKWGLDTHLAELTGDAPLP